MSLGMGFMPCLKFRSEYFSGYSIVEGSAQLLYAGTTFVPKTSSSTSSGNTLTFPHRMSFIFVTGMPFFLQMEDALRPIAPYRFTSSLMLFLDT